MTWSVRAILTLVSLAAVMVAVWFLFLRVPSGGRHPGTARMAERLTQLTLDVEAAAREEPSANPFAVYQPGRIEELRRKLAETSDPFEILVLRYRVAVQLLLGGKTAQALEEFEALDSLLERFPFPIPTERKARLTASLQSMTGVAALRLAEEENCLADHGIDSCLFPIQGSGVHRFTRGSRRAVDAFTRQLSAVPGSLDAAWLLNLAYMTLGEYPGRVPQEWLLPPGLFASDHDIGRFRDASIATGLDLLGLAGGAIMEDFNEDGYMDIMASSWGLGDQLRYLQSDGKGGFIDRTQEAGLTGEVGGLNMIHGDYNNDGYADVLVLRGGWLSEWGRHPNSLLRNNGDGTFDDVTEEAGLLTFHPSQTAAWGDFNNDGLLDLFVGNEEWSPEDPHPSQLFLNQGGGTFEECALEAGITGLGPVKGVAWGDYDNDGRLDLYVSSFGRSNFLFRNDGPAGSGGAEDPWKFTDVTQEAGVQEPVFSFPTWFWDYDNDGLLDIFVAAYDGVDIGVVAAHYLGISQRAEVPRLFRNNGDGTFRDVTKQARLDRVLLVMGANFGDLDNDGFLDLYAGTGAPELSTLMPNRMFRNFNGEFFEDVTSSGGFGHLQKGHGVAFGDLDNDGDQDIYAVMGGWYSCDGYPNVMFENPGHGNHWITVRLEGVGSNRAGVGARIRIRVTTDEGPRDIYTTVSTGGSFGSSTLQQEVGLGDATGIEVLEVVWPATGLTQVFPDLSMDQFVRIREGDPRVTSLPRDRIGLPSRGRPRQRD